MESGRMDIKQIGGSGETNGMEERERIMERGGIITRVDEDAEKGETKIHKATERARGKRIPRTQPQPRPPGPEWSLGMPGWAGGEDCPRLKTPT